MKTQKFNIHVSYFIALILCMSCGNKAKNADSGLKNVETAVIEVSISGMTCTGCEQKIQAGVGKLEGINSVKADHTAGNAIIEYNASVTDTTKIKDAIKGTGYNVIKFKPYTGTGQGI